MKIVVLAGELSHARTVSLVIVTDIFRALRRRGRKAILVGLDYDALCEEILKQSVQIRRRA